VAFAELRDKALILPTNARQYGDYLAPALAQHGFRPRALVESASYTLIRQLVQANVGMAIVPRLVCDGSVAWARLVEPTITRQVGWLERQGAPDVASRQTFKALLHERCRAFRTA
jgi:DNA-binding transcriptional LysR family regulator